MNSLQPILVPGSLSKNAARINTAAPRPTEAIVARAALLSTPSQPRAQTATATPVAIPTAGARVELPLLELPTRLEQEALQQRQARARVTTREELLLVPSLEVLLEVSP